MDLKEIRLEGVDLIVLARAGYGQLAGFCENGNELAGSIKCTEILG